MSWILYALLALALLEVALQVLVRYLRRDFKWLINESDETPALDRAALEKFLENGFDPILGWSRKPNTSGTERAREKTVNFSIDEKGSRSLKHLSSNLVPQVAAFGDSYAFCRQVEDSETWESYMAEATGAAVLNFGVGNYGADQALLRYEKSELPASVKTVVLAFVPETICRVQSYWKHYLEFGNTFAFKPRFVQEESRLRLLPNLINAPAKFQDYTRHLPELQKYDFFYRQKFRKVQFRFPYLVSLGRAPRRNGKILALLAARALKPKNPTDGDSAFEFIMRNNIIDAHRLYRDPPSTQLLQSILLRFAETASLRGHRPVVLVLPQMIDLKLGPESRSAYQAFFAKLGNSVTTIDLTSDLENYPDLQSLYTEDLYGGHLSAAGNRMVAKLLWEKIKNENHLPAS